MGIEPGQVSQNGASSNAMDWEGLAENGPGVPNTSISTWMNDMAKTEQADSQATYQNQLPLETEMRPTASTINPTDPAPNPTTRETREHSR